MTEKGGLPILAFSSQQTWEDWLAANHATVRGIWMQISHKDASAPSVTYREAVETALCFGWIDGQANAFDAHSHLQRFTPRRPRSRWSQINRERAERLTSEGRMRPAGQAQIEAARADGRWEAAYAPPSRVTVPDELRDALAANPAAEAAFERLSRSARFMLLSRIQAAKRPETRARRIALCVEALAQGRTP
jgi:uncharacterized protein YdeI (YjbR/CyaY-like superfamily)